ncbi:hypothetical protein D3C86_1135030 [compost metagenome]
MFHNLLVIVIKDLIFTNIEGKIKCTVLIGHQHIITIIALRFLFCPVFQENLGHLVVYNNYLIDFILQQEIVLELQERNFFILSATKTDELHTDYNR